MARIRTIKPEFFTSETILELDPLARLFFIGLWCEADRDGLLKWKPRTLKMRYLPGDNADIDAITEQLLEQECIFIYEVEGKEYCSIPEFLTHQVINNRERASGIPKFDATLTRESGVKAEGRERKGKEGKGKELNPLSASPTVEQEVFNHWKAVMDKNNSAKLNKKRLSAIKARLKEGYTEQDIKTAIDGCANTPHNMGQNDRGELYNDLELICRDGSNLERFKGNVNRVRAQLTNGPSILSMQPPAPHADYIDHEQQGIEYAPE